MSHLSDAEREIRERVLADYKGRDPICQTLGERFDIVIDELRVISKRGITHQERWNELAPSFAWNGGSGRDRRRVAEALAIIEGCGELDRWLELSVQVQSELAGEHDRE
jgi:hypothetical protein